MIRRVVPLALLGGLLLTGVLSLGSFEPADAARVARLPLPPPPDTVRASVPAGRALVYTLPDAVGGRTVDTYRLLRGPTLSGVAGRSLTWITRRTAPGTYTVLLEARRPDAPSDTLVVQIDVQQ